VYDERTSDVHQPLRLPGQEAEEFSTSEGPNGASGRYYNGFRWYRAQYGRYTQPDPLSYAGSTYNLYAYANNNLFSYVDSLGLDCSPWQGPPSWFRPALLGIAAGALLFTGFGIGELALDLYFLGAGGAVEELADVFGVLDVADAAESEGEVASLAGEGAAALGDAAEASIESAATAATNEAASDSLGSVAEGLSSSTIDGELPSIAEGAAEENAYHPTMAF
jgi:RHS repeat-associated protein